MKTIFYSLLVMLLFNSACTKGKNQNLASPTPPAPDVLLQSGKTLDQVKAANVPYRLYQLLSASPQNINFSPLSLNMAFALVYEGTDGKTRQMLQQIFDFPNDAENYSFDQELATTKSPSVELYIGNSVWAKHPKLVLDDYKKTISNKMNASVNPLDLAKLNEWVAETTKGKIKTLLNALPPKAEAVFINAFYLKAAWATAFKTASTRPGKFQSSLHMMVTAPMMHAEENYSYYEDEESKWIELPYRDSPLVMDLALPQKRFNLRAIENKLSPEYLNTIYSKFVLEKTDLQLPKFKFNTSRSLMQLFVDAGYVDLFKEGDFSRFEKSTDPLSLSEIIQATSITVDEEGTTAAAATAVTMMKASFVINMKKFVADQPFLFLIRNKKTGEVYFIGRVFDPHSES